MTELTFSEKSQVGFAMAARINELLERKKVLLRTGTRKEIINIIDDDLQACKSVLEKIGFKA